MPELQSSELPADQGELSLLWTLDIRGQSRRYARPLRSTLMITRGYCDLKCPVPTFDTRELRRAATMSLVLGWLGYVLTLIVICVMVFSKRYDEQEEIRCDVPTC